MILQVHEQGLNLKCPEDLKSYSVQVDDSECSKERIIALHPELLSIEPARVAVSQEILRALAGELAHDQEWRSGFDDMVKYANSKGWVTEAGEIIGHVE